jgi:hypothetical protein
MPGMKMKRFNHGPSGDARQGLALRMVMPVSLCMTARYTHCLALLVLLAGSLAAADQAGVSYEREIKPLLSTYCYKCHGAEKQKGDLNLATIANDDAAHRAGKTWRRVLDKLRVKDMPPEEAPQPSAAEWERLKAGIAILKRPLGPPDPGRVTIRRLNRKEFDNTLHDLIGLDLKSSADFPADDVGDGFDNIGDVLTLSPILFEKYLDSADRILDKAIVDEQVNLKLTGEQLPATVDGKPVEASADGKGRAFTAIGEAFLDVAAPSDGKYTIKIKAGGEQAGSEPVRMLVKVGNEVVKEFKITASRTSPTTVSATLSLMKGANHVAVCFANPYTEAAMSASPPAATPKPSAAAAAKPPPGKPGTRTLIVDLVELVGPPAPPLTDIHKRIFIAKPGPELGKREAARTIIEHFATRAFREPVAKAKLDRLMALFDMADKQGETFNGSVKEALEGVLISPYFLYRLEHEQPDGPSGGVVPVSDWELASRMSYFLWSSMPDDELLDLAKEGKLHDPATLDKQTRRMLLSPKSHALVETFAEQWLQLRSLASHEPDPGEFPDFDKPLRKAMYDEATMFFESVMREDRSIIDFLDSDYTFLNDRLAKHYGIADVSGPAMRKVKLNDRNRGGVLSMASILTVTSGPTRTSPVRRGQWILEQILGDPAPPPPPGVKRLPTPGKDADASLSLRKLMEQHRADPACASCHQRMDPLGFGFENYDAIGRWRERDGSAAIDAAGTMPGGKAFKGPAELKAMLVANKEAFVRTFSAKLLTFALGRSLLDCDDDTIDQLDKALEHDQYRFSTLVTRIVASFPFLNRRNR